jgi:superfamily II DNA/RNA helicase
VQRRAAPVIAAGDDCVIESETGSGKTLAFLLPSLAALRYPPDLYPDDLAGPQLLVVVPTRELGVQAAMLAYKLFGGSVNPGVEPGSGGNMFRFGGPRGLRVKGLLLASEVGAAVEERYLAGAHVVVGTPDLIQEAMGRGVQVAQHAAVVAVDEVDACFACFPAQMEALLGAAVTGEGGNHAPAAAPAPATAAELRYPSAPADAAAPPPPPRQRPTVVLVGATIDDALIERCAAAGWVADPVRVAVGQRMRVPSGLRHRYIVADEAGRLGALCRQLRGDLRAGSPDGAPARVMVFAAGEAQARALAGPLRTVLWGDHKISVLLPEGEEPITALHAFRDNRATLLVATPAAARGLDLPAVSHVYNVAPPRDAADYLHRAGRAGRIGSPVPGTVTTLVTEAEVAALQGAAAALGLELERIEAPAPTELGSAEGDVDVEAVRRALEDLLAWTPGGEGQEGAGEGAE